MRLQRSPDDRALDVEGASATLFANRSADELTATTRPPPYEDQLTAARPPLISRDPAQQNLCGIISFRNSFWNRASVKRLPLVHEVGAVQWPKRIASRCPVARRGLTLHGR